MTFWSRLHSWAALSKAKHYNVKSNNFSAKTTLVTIVYISSSIKQPIQQMNPVHWFYATVDILLAFIAIKTVELKISFIVYFYY